MTTIFEKIIAKELPATIHYEDEDVICIDDAYPQAETHFLVITKKVIPSINELKEDDYPLLKKVFKVIQEMTAKMGIEDSYRVVTNHGREAGQTVFHLHFHVLAGKMHGSREG